MRLSKNDKTFIDTVKNVCKKHKISCKLKEVKYLKPIPSVRCTGYFDDEGKTLQVAMKQKDSFEILEELTGKHILLVDDTLTTGATMLAAAEKIKAAGAKEVSFFTLAALK